MNRFFDCKYVMKNFSEFDTTVTSTPGERIIAEKLNEISKNPYFKPAFFFREYNILRGKRIDFLIYIPNVCFIILEIKDWDNDFINSIEHKSTNHITEFYKLSFKFKKKSYSDKSPYETQTKTYLKGLNELFKKSISVTPKNNIPVYSFVVFTMLDSEEFEKKFKETNGELKLNILNAIKKHTLFKEDIEDFATYLLQKMNEQQSFYNEFGVRQSEVIKWIECPTDIGSTIRVLYQFNEQNNELLLDQKQLYIAQSLDKFEKNYLFLYGVVGSGKTLILERRMEIFKNRKEIELNNHKKFLVFMKDSHSMLFKKFKEKYHSDNICIIDFLTEESNLQIKEDGVSFIDEFHRQRHINWNEIDEIFIEEAHSIISNSKRSLEKLKSLMESAYYYCNNIKIIMLLDSNQIEYSRDYIKEFWSPLKFCLPEKLGLNIENYHMEELNICYRLSHENSEFSFKYLKYYMKKKNLAYFLEQSYSPLPSISELERVEMYIYLDEAEIVRRLKESINKGIDEFNTFDLRYSKNLIILSSGKLTGMSMEYFKDPTIQFINDLKDLKDYDYNKKITISRNIRFLQGMEFDNVIIISKLDDFFIQDNDPNFEEKIYLNYISLTRSLGKQFFCFINAGIDTINIRQSIDSILAEKSLWDDYREKFK